MPESNTPMARESLMCEGKVIVTTIGCKHVVVRCGRAGGRAYLEFANTPRLRMIYRNARASKNVRPENSRAEVVCPLDRQSRFRGESEIIEAGILDCHAATEHHRRLDAWSRSEQCDPGHSRPARADAGIRSALAARHGPRRHRNADRSEEHTSELQSLRHLVCRLLLEKKKKKKRNKKKYKIIN